MNCQRIWGQTGPIHSDSPSAFGSLKQTPVHVLSTRPPQGLPSAGIKRKLIHANQTGLHSQTPSVASSPQPQL